MEILEHIPVEYDMEAVLARLRIAPGSEDAEAAAELVARVRAVVNPKATYALCSIGERRSDTVEFGGVTFTSRVLTVNLEKVHRVFPFVVTCGVELEEVEGAAGDPLAEYWLDELRIIALGAASAHLRRHIEERYRPGKITSMSPGSLKDWPLTQQRELFSALGDVEGAIGVRLTESFLMRPMKSVSGVYFQTETSFESCQLCPREDCPGRRAPYDERLWQERYAERADRPG